MNDIKVDDMLELGLWLGRHQAFGVIANRCSAADAECLKVIRDQGQYRKLGLSWEQFCEKRVGVSRVTADRQIRHLEEFGPNYHRLAEIMPLSPATYRLLGTSVTDAGLEHNGEVIPITRENREKLSRAVVDARAKAKPKPAAASSMAGVRKCMDSFLAEVDGISSHPDQRFELITFLDQESYHLKTLASLLRQKSLTE